MTRIEGGRLTIGELARRTGIPTSTLRYYERSGLIEPVARTGANYRLYGPHEVDRLRFIRAAQTAGFTLVDIRMLLDYRDGRPVPCRDVRSMIENRLAAVEERVREYRGIQRVPRAFLKECVVSEDEEPCHVMEKLVHDGP